MLHRVFKTLVVLVFLNFSLITHAQERYQQALFDSIETETYTYATKNGQNLDLDVYSAFNDQVELRPVIIYVHGGGFSGGTRNSESIARFCKKLASYGYVSVSISYRLTRQGQPTEFGCDCPATEKINTFHAAVEDLQDATYFLIQHRESLKIDPQRIILAGSSAGAETVLNTAYQPPMCYGLESGPVSYAGVIAMAGAIPDTIKIFRESAVPSLLFHGTCDNLVPYAEASHRHCRPDQPGYLNMFGSYSIAHRLEQLKVPFWLHTSCGAGHEMASKPMTEYFDVIIRFCEDYVLKKTGESRRTVIPGDQKKCTYEQFNFCNP